MSPVVIIVNKNLAPLCVGAASAGALVDAVLSYGVPLKHKVKVRKG